MVPVRASAIEFMYCLVDEIRPTRSAVLAGISLTTDELHRTIFSAILRLACARVIGSAIGAYTVLARRVPFAFVDVVLTMISLVTLLAFAGVSADTIHAGSGLARIAFALVDIYLAIFPRHTLDAETLVPERRIQGN